MKHLLTILVIIISATSFGQTADDYLKSGIEKYNSKNFEGAIKDYTQAIKINGNLKDGYFHRGVSEWALQDFESAKKDFGKTIQLDPKFTEAYFDRAVILISQQEFTQALADLDKTIALGESSTRALMFRGEIRAHSGNIEGACEDFNKAKENGDLQAEKYINEYCGIPKDELVYDTIASAICSCAGTNQTKKVSIILDYCYELTIKNNYKALQKLGIDSKTQAGQDKLRNEILSNRFRLSCKDVYAKFVEEIQKEMEKEDSNTLIFTGRFVSQTPDSGKKKYYVLILQSTKTKEKKEFYSEMFIDEDARNYDITVKYEIVKNKETNKQELIVKSFSYSSISE
jgi:tetratricopeptide (TPR) repeat protein